MTDFANTGARLDPTTKNDWVKDYYWQELFNITKSHVGLDDVTSLQDWVTHQAVDRIYNYVERLIIEKEEEVNIEVINCDTFCHQIEHDEVSFINTGRQNHININHLDLLLKGGYKSIVIDDFDAPVGIWRCRRRFRPSGTDCSGTYIPVLINVCDVKRLYIFQLIPHDCEICIEKAKNPIIHRVINMDEIFQM